MATSDLKRLKELEAENARLKPMYADMAQENQAVNDLLGKL
jgi:putative transposase